MGEKGDRSTLYVPQDLIHEAKKLGLNPSVLSRNAVQEAVDLMKKSKLQVKEVSTCSDIRAQNV